VYFHFLQDSKVGKMKKLLHQNHHHPLGLEQYRDLLIHLRRHRQMLLLKNLNCLQLLLFQQYQRLHLRLLLLDKNQDYMKRLNPHYNLKYKLLGKLYKYIEEFFLL